MAVTATVSNHAKYQLAKGNIDLSADTLKVILMNTTFTMDEDADATLSDVTADQIATGNGYTQDNKTISNQGVSEDDANDKAAFTCDDVTFTASGGDFPAVGAYIVYDDTTGDDTVLFCVDFGTDHTVVDGQSLQLQSITIDLS